MKLPFGIRPWQAALGALGVLLLLFGQVPVSPPPVFDLDADLARIGALRKIAPRAALSPLPLVGGRPAAPGEAPGSIKLAVADRWMGMEATNHCGALRIARRWALTAAHCAPQPWRGAEAIFGAAPADPEAPRFRVSEIVLHAQFEPSRAGMLRADVALLYFGEGAPEAGEASLADWEDLTVAEGERLICYGYGAREDGSLSPVLERIETFVKTVSGPVLMVENPTGARINSGDSGHVCVNEAGAAVGVNSGHNGPGSPQQLTYLRAFRPWVEQVMAAYAVRGL